MIDKSAYVRLNQSRDVDLWLERIDRGMIAQVTGQPAEHLVGDF